MPSTWCPLPEGTNSCLGRWNSKPFCKWRVSLLCDVSRVAARDPSNSGSSQVWRGYQKPQWQLEQQKWLLFFSTLRMEENLSLPSLLWGGAEACSHPQIPLQPNTDFSDVFFFCITPRVREPFFVYTAICRYALVLLPFSISYQQLCLKFWAICQARRNWY